jgi:4-hydroxybenzoate polyprenyltransferase
MWAKIRAWLILTRGSNLPTVWSNLFVGWLLGFIFAQHMPIIINAAILLVGLWMGVSLTYVGGMILNDAFDAKWDAERRSTRPIPAGIIPRWQAFAVGIFCLVFGYIITVNSSYSDGRNVFNEHRVLVRKLALLLAFCVLVYDRWHKQVAWAPLVMATCRALLPLIGFAAVGDVKMLFALDVTQVLAMLVHPLVLWILTCSITLVARYEASEGQPPRWAEWLLFLIPVPLLWSGAVWGRGYFIWALFACGLFWFWIRRSNRRNPLPAGVGRRVADRLAAFPFLDLAADTAFLFFTAQMMGSESSLENMYVGVTRHLGLFWMIPMMCFGLTLLFRRWIPTT